MTDKINHIQILLNGWKRTRASASDESIVDYATAYIDGLEAALVILGAMTDADTDVHRRLVALESHPPEHSVIADLPERHRLEGYGI